MTQANATSRNRRKRCPYCRQAAEVKPLYFHQYQVYSDGEDAREDYLVSSDCAFYIVACSNCSKIQVYHSENEIYDLSEYENGNLVFPESSRLDHVPTQVTNIYLEALKVRHISARAFANQIRVAIEAVCDDKGAKGRTLEKRVQDLEKTGILTPLLKDAADLIRWIGNDGSHFNKTQVLEWEVKAVDDLFKTLIEYIYIGPKRIELFNESYRKLKTGETLASAKEIEVEDE